MQHSFVNERSNRTPRKSLWNAQSLLAPCIAAACCRAREIAKSTKYRALPRRHSAVLSLAHCSCMHRFGDRRFHAVVDRNRFRPGVSCIHRSLNNENAIPGMFLSSPTISVTSSLRSRESHNSLISNYDRFSFLCHSSHRRNTRNNTVLVRLGVAYNERMARGWESKAVEEQISAAEARKDAKVARALSRVEIEQQTRKKGLLLELVRLTRELESTRNQRYRELLERSLDHVQGELAKLEA